ncbi:MAG: hypothetical protein KQI62_03735 [Deltaproteobacteria bacterium]|nr:hypothetical protein [Deltaproteobacteria bacterium]
MTVTGSQFSEATPSVEWLSQFSKQDRVLAAELLDAMTVISSDSFDKEMSNLVEHRAGKLKGHIGLFIERETKETQKKPQVPLFQEGLSDGRMRAFGKGPPLLLEREDGKQEAGSEALLALIATKLKRKHPDTFTVLPGPDLIREKQIRNVIILTDFIGSGNRIADYLEAAWTISSVKSWHSLKWFHFEVVAFSATNRGLKMTKQHPSRPKVSIVRPCPTIDSEFPAPSLVKELCIRYDPLKKGDPLGFDGTGSLIAFAHGCPNNAPRILHKTSKDWQPLFPARVTDSLRAEFNRVENKPVIDRMERLRDKVLSQPGWEGFTSIEGQSLLLVLSGLQKGSRKPDILSRKTGLTVPEIKMIIEKMQNWGWTNSKGTLTDEGQGVLRHAKKYAQDLVNRRNGTRCSHNDNFYFPSSLRMPHG